MEEDQLAAARSMEVPELDVCSHKHQILAVADESDGDDPVLFILYHWRPPSNSEPTAQLFSALVSQLPAPNRGTRMQFVTFPVVGDSSDQVIGEGCFPVWRWVKPESVYPRKRGVWETKLHKALDDGEWNAGKDLTLLVRGVSEHGLQAVERAGYTTASLDSIISQNLSYHAVLFKRGCKAYVAMAMILK
ncbi:hypothetical protein P885DRAFT_62993 [Corynascus similis CBS 632.67]